MYAPTSRGGLVRPASNEYAPRLPRRRRTARSQTRLPSGWEKLQGGHCTLVWWVRDQTKGVACFSAYETKHQRISNLREREVLVDMLWLLTVSQALWAAPPAIMPALRLVPPVMRVYAGGDIVPPMEDSSMVVQGGSRCTWSAEEEWNEQVQIVLSTEGHTLDAEIELWYGPDNSIPCTMRVYSEDGHVRPVSAVIETPGDENTVAIRNIGLSEFPVTADLITEIVDTPLANTRELADST